MDKINLDGDGKGEMVEERMRWSWQGWDGRGKDGMVVARRGLKSQAWEGSVSASYTHLRDQQTLQ